MFLKAAKTAAVAVGMMEASAEQMEEQPCASDENYALPANPVDSHIPATVGLVKGKVFDPQVHFELLTELFGVHKGVEKKRTFSCPNCDHEHSETVEANFDLDVEAVCEEEDCGYEGTVADFYDCTEEETSTSRDPNNGECNLVLHGTDWRNMVLPWNIDDAKEELNYYFNQLNGHESEELSLDWGSTKTLHPLPQAEVVDFDECEEEEDE